MDTSIPGYCLSLLLFTAIATSAGTNGSNDEELREPRVSGRIVKLYSGAKPNPYLCTGEGFQADPSSCASFYRCVKERSGKFTVFRYQCAPGTVFDPDLETCNHPHSTRRTECGGVLKPTNEPHHTSHTNSNEIDEAQSEFPRPISTKMPIYAEQTRPKNPTSLSSVTTERVKIPSKMPWTSIMQGSSSTLSTTKLPDSMNNKNQWLFSTQHQLGSQYTSKLPPKTTQSSDPKNTEPCISDGFMADSENCRKFYRCVANQRGGYVKYEFSCSESTVWDDDIQGCNHPWAVKRSKCGRSLSLDDKSTSLKQEPDPTEESATKVSTIINKESDNKFNKTIQQQLQISHGSEVAQTQTQISNSPDVIQNQTQINFGDRVKNNNNSKSKQNQTQINYWSAVSQSQTQINYGNKGIQTQVQINHSKDSSQSQVQIVDSTTQSTLANNNGKNDCSESGFMGDAYDCKKFYRCVNNGRGYTKYGYSCGEGTVWDPKIEACNHAWAVKECSAIYDGGVSATGTHPTTTSQSTEYHTDINKITPSYTTSQVPDISDEDDIGYVSQNNQEVTSSSTTTTKTTTTAKSTTRKPSGTAPECTTSGFMGDSKDCKIFYRCVDNGNGGFIKHEFKCGDGTVWDPDIEACNHAWAVKNCGGYSSSSSTSKEETTTKRDNTTPLENVHTTVTLVQVSTQAPTQSDDYESGYGSQNHELSTTITTTTSSSTTSKPLTQPQEQSTSNIRVCKSSGFVGDESDCKKFYRCVDNGNGGYIKYEFTCGQGTVWDSKIDACNHVWAVDKCGGSNKVNESSSFETTSQSTSTSSSDSSGSIQTTEVSKETDSPMTTASTTTNSNASSSTSNRCSNSGFMGDVTDCKRFYRCVDNGDGSYTRYEFTCGEGTVWDPKIEACNHAWAVEKCGGSADSIVTHVTQQTTLKYPVMEDEQLENGYVTQSYETSGTSQSTATSSLSSTTLTTSAETSHCTNSGFMGDKNDCKKFYRCVDNGKGDYDRYEFQCGEGTVWDQSIEACNHAWAVKHCGGSGSSTTHIQKETTTQSISNSDTVGNGQTQQSTEIITTTTETHPSTWPIKSDKCLQEGFYSNKNDCKKFYRCVDNGNGKFTKYEFTCGEGTSWNQDIQGCDHISSDRPCGSTVLQVTTSQPTYLNDDMDTQSVSTTKATTPIEATESESIQSTKSPEGSKGTCYSEGFYANPTNCKTFYRCVANSNGGYTKYDFNCGDGTVWNQEIQACDHESSDNSCSGSTSTQTQTTESLSHSTTISYLTTNKQDTTAKPATGSMENQCTSEGFFAHPNDCNKFIRCVDNGNGGYTQYDFSCGDGTVWVQEIQACDHGNDINSCSSQVESTISSQPSITEISSSSMSTSSSSTTSSTERMPSYDEYPTENSKEPSHDETDDCTSEGYFANKQDCRKFYRCVDNGKGGYTKYDFVCGEGTAWDSDLQTCNHINEVQSCAASTSEGNENHQTTTNKNQAESEGTSSTTRATTSSGSSSSSNVQNTCEREGYYGDKKDCKKFYRCVDNGKGGFTKYDYTCGEGTIWDQDITTCNHPQDVSNPSCTSGQEHNETSSTTSSTTSSSQITSSTTESTSNGQGTSDGPQESSKKPASNDVTCDKAGYYANPTDCKKFYRCVDWDGDGKRFSVFHFECGEGTIWDPALDTCNYEDSVYPQRDCSQSQPQNVGGETEATSTTTTESTTSEQTTQESTSEQTTSHQTTSDQTTTEQGNEPTTTQQTTTSEKTTTQESSTNEPTTTQETTTSEINTTEESTTIEQTNTTEQTTTEKSTTSEQTTTQQSTTNEQTSTQQPTTEQTTTQKSSESTTQQSTTSEQTTTEQTTTSEQTTTQQSTTSEQTTTQQPTTEQTTTQKSSESSTQQSTTSEQTTTEQTITSEQTTTQQSTTSEQTTTQQPTTEQTTTQQSSESTTQQSTSSEPTTTEQTTTSEQTTTQQPTTSEETTTQQPTTEQTTTQKTSESTTQQSTTSEQTTTEQTTTSEQTTTQQSITSEQTTTQQSTTEQTTTEKSSETTQESSTTDQSTTQQSTTSEQTTTQQSTTTDQTTTQESITSEQTTTQQSTSEQTTTQQSTTTEQITTEQSSESTTEQSSTTTELITDSTSTTDSTTDGTTTEVTTDQSTTQMSSTESDSTEDSSSTSEESSSDNKCPETEDDQYLFVCPTSFKRHPKYCNMFYQCTEDDETPEAKVAMFKCPNNTIYDENKIQCVIENKADKKCDGEIANKRRFKRLGSNYRELILADKESLSCSGTGYFSFEKQSECAKGFLKCEKSKSGELRGHVYQCPDNYVYWSISKRCERIESVRDCKRSNNDWTGRWNIPVERKNLAIS